MRVLSLKNYTIHILRACSDDHSLKIRYLERNYKDIDPLMYVPLLCYLYLTEVDSSDETIIPYLKELNLMGKATEQRLIKYLESSHIKPFNDYIDKYKQNSEERSKREMKHYYREEILRRKEAYNITDYRLCELANVNQANFNGFFYHSKDNRLSFKKLERMYHILSYEPRNEKKKKIKKDRKQENMEKDYRLTGEEVFTVNGKDTHLNILDFWQWHFCERFDLQDKIAEYIVCKALGLDHADNVGQWTLFDAMYRNKRIEIKETSYMHAWQSDEEEKSKTRTFGITKAYSNYQDNTSTFERQNDIYVFCLNTGFSRESSDPLEMNHWEFYIIPTSVINDQCGDAKTISLSRVKKLTEAVKYEDIKATIDNIIDSMN